MTLVTPESASMNRAEPSEPVATTHGSSVASVAPGAVSPVEAAPVVAPQAAWFGPVDRALFGWYHAPSGAVPRDCGVVLCNPFGYEQMCTHRSYRHLADRLASAGFPAMRFDYDGTGDSAGSDEDPERVAAWLDSVERAVAELTARSGVRQVCLFGVRLGALLATALAARRPVDSLVLVGPALSGRTYLREMRAFRMLKGNGAEAPRPPEAPDAPKVEEAVGYLLGEATTADLSKIDLLKLGARPAARALVVARDDITSGEERLVKALLGSGVEATLSKTPGYAAMMQDDPYKCVVPDAVWSEIVAWLERAHPGARERPEAAVSGGGSVVQTGGGGPVREELVAFEGMFGVLTEPLDAPPPARPAIVLLTTGANHRVGNNRMYVHMARAWAAAGFRVLRFDLSGIGDSPAAGGARENEVYSPRGIQEARAAMSFLTASRGSESFVLAGLCSGAYVSFHAGVADPRVRGVMLVNPLTFHWKEGDSLEVKTRKTFKSTRFYSRALTDLATWRRTLSGDIHVRAIMKELGTRAFSRAQRALLGLGAKVRGRDGEVSDVARGFRQMCDRGTEVMLVFGADDGGIDVMEEHLGVGARKLHKKKGFRLEIIDGPDHTFTPLWSQRHLREMLTQHLVTRFG